ncbi:hypothetical protein [Paraburkholderia jirisanensis]
MFLVGMTGQTRSMPMRGALRSASARVVGEADSKAGNWAGRVAQAAGCCGEQYMRFCGAQYRCHRRGVGIVAPMRQRLCAARGAVWLRRDGQAVLAALR